MSNFYGKCFLSSLLGALSVLSSPVASAVGGKLGEGNLEGEVESSAGRSKNGGKGGKLEVNREVKSVDGLKEVLKETGGEVVRVSPDGKGGFVAFVKTPTGKVVTVAIVGVPLLVVLGLVARYVFSGQKNDGAEGEDESIGDEDMDEKKNSEIVVKGATGKLSSLFGSEDRYDSFVKRLFSDFFNDPNGVLEKKFYECEKSLDEFLEAVFRKSSFVVGGFIWGVDKVLSSSVFWSCANVVAVGFGSKRSKSVEGVFNYLSTSFFVDFSVGYQQVSWGDKISAVLFSFWCFVRFNLDVEDDADGIEEKLAGEDRNDLKRVFETISDYVKERLEIASRGYNGQELKQVN